MPRSSVAPSERTRVKRMHERGAMTARALVPFWMRSRWRDPPIIIRSIVVR
jgi:hypothetical protein